MTIRMDWKPIQTAPVDKQVALAKWHRSFDKWVWIESSGIVFRTKTRFFRTVIEPGYNHEEYQYWAELPPPPSEPKEAE